MLPKPEVEVVPGKPTVPNAKKKIAANAAKRVGGEHGESSGAGIKKFKSKTNVKSKENVSTDESSGEDYGVDTDMIDSLQKQLNELKRRSKKHRGSE